jgi:hypothetical protein
MLKKALLTLGLLLTAPFALVNCAASGSGSVGDEGASGSASGSVGDDDASSSSSTRTRD